MPGWPECSHYSRYLNDYAPAAQFGGVLGGTNWVLTLYSCSAGGVNWSATLGRSIVPRSSSWWQAAECKCRLDRKTSSVKSWEAREWPPVWILQCKWNKDGEGGSINSTRTAIIMHLLFRVSRKVAVMHCLQSNPLRANSLTVNFTYGKHTDTHRYNKLAYSKFHLW